MKNKAIILQENNAEMSVRFKRSVNNSQLYKYAEVCYTAPIKSSELNTVGVSKDVYDALRGVGLILFCPDNGKYLEIAIRPTDVDSDKITATSYVVESLDLHEGDKLLLLENKTFVFSNIRKQKVENIKEDYVAISPCDVNGNNIELDKFSLFQLTNYYTGDSIVVQKKHIQVCASLKPGTILLNKKQRTFLGAELPKYISNSYWTEIVNRIPQGSKELKLLEKAYPTSDRFLTDGLDYETKQKVLGIISDYCKPRLGLTPVVESYCQKTKRGMKAVADFYVGKSTLSLMCRRPYGSDEGSDVVRISPSNMSLLGITEMDKVIVTYKGKSAKCRVLALEDEKAFSDSNLPASTNCVIGIPAHIRKKLGLCNINAAVKVDRDTGFILKKSANEQIVPILLTLFSINLFDDPSIWKKALVSLLAIPIVVYLNLSSKRNMRG